MEEELKKTSRSVVEELMNWSLIHLELLVAVVGHSTSEQPLLLEPQELLQTGTSTVVHCWKKLLAYPSLRLVYSSGSSLP